MPLNDEGGSMVEEVFHRLYPPFLINDLLSEDEFRTCYKFSVRSFVTLGDENDKFDQSLLFSAIRESYKVKGETVSIIDDNGDSWEVVTSEIDGFNSVYIERDGVKYAMDIFWPLEPDIESRLKFFDKACYGWANAASDCTTYCS